MFQTIWNKNKYTLDCVVVVVILELPQTFRHKKTDFTIWFLISNLKIKENWMWKKCNEIREKRKKQRATASK